MFIQVIQGRVSDVDAVRAAMDRWREELEPGAQGYLGGTYGVTDDGMFVAVVRFESEEAARRNSDRPEQGAWWREFEQQFSGPVTFHDCSDVTLLLQGGSDEAGFVQVIQGRVRDRDRLHQIVEQTNGLLSRYRPDVIGATVAIDADGVLTETVAFTTEAAAREGERKELPEEARRVIEEEMSLLDELTYLDLHHPWFTSHR